MFRERKGHRRWKQRKKREWIANLMVQDFHIFSVGPIILFWRVEELVVEKVG